MTLNRIRFSYLDRGRGAPFVFKFADTLAELGALRNARSRMGTRPQSAVCQIAPEGEPVLVALAAAEREPEQHLAALQRDAPGHQHTLGRLVVGPQLEVQGIQEQVHEVVLVKAALAPAPVALPGVLADPGDGRRAD